MLTVKIRPRRNLSPFFPRVFFPLAVSISLRENSGDISNMFDMLVSLIPFKEHSISSYISMRAADGRRDICCEGCGHAPADWGKGF